MGERERKKREGGGDNLFRRGINYSGIDHPGDNLLRGIIYFVTLAGSRSIFAYASELGIPPRWVHTSAHFHVGYIPPRWVCHGKNYPAKN